jgi:hypothetical protein
MTSKAFILRITHVESSSKSTSRANHLLYKMYCYEPDQNLYVLHAIRDDKKLL